jgi:nitrous oxidase accessory protein NosD
MLIRGYSERFWRIKICVSASGCGSGIVLQSATGALVYHNNLVNDSIQASDNNPGKNQWDNGYPSGGNYWSDYTGVDNCSGPQQNVCTGPDGVGDTPYLFTNAKDRYPLMKPYTSNSTGGPNGGVMLTVNRLALVAPYVVLALIGSGVAIAFTLSARQAKRKSDGCISVSP